jgi:Lsr2
MQLTIDSNEPLDHVLRVVESLYGVKLSATTKPPADKATRSSRARAAKPRSVRSGATRNTAKPTAPAQRPAGRNAAKTDPAAIRNWARANGHVIRDRGRVPATILAAYKSSSKVTRGDRRGAKPRA